jgi:hypothetical protein
MDEKKYSRKQGVKRHTVVMDRDCRLGVISCENFVWTEHSVKIVDLSIIGIGVETERQIEPGIIWFKEPVYGQRCGFLIWSKQFGDRYRSGIQFVSLNRADEEYLHRQVSRTQSREPFQDPDQVLARMMDGFNKDRDGYINPSA